MAQFTPLVLYSSWPPASTLLRLRVPALVMVSVAAPVMLPLSHTRPTVGATGAALSSVKLRLDASLTLPALSVTRAYTVLAPSLAAKVLPQTVPLVLYSKVAPASAVTLSVPLLVSLSAPWLPLSHTRVSTAGVGAVLSRVKL